MILALLSGALAVTVDISILSEIVVRLFIVSAAGCIIIALMFFNKKWISILKRIVPHRLQQKIALLIKVLRDVVHYGTTPVVLLYGLIISAVFQAAGIAATYLIALGLGSTMAFI
ncbi:unnamed protein product, partial [marine sediment metagenome]